MQLKDIYEQLKQRRVIRAAIAHVISMATFPITLIIAWFFEHPWHKYTGSWLGEVNGPNDSSTTAKLIFRRASA